MPYMKMSGRRRGNSWSITPRRRDASGSVAWVQKVPTTSVRVFGPMRSTRRDIDWSRNRGPRGRRPPSRSCREWCGPSGGRPAGYGVRQVFCNRLNLFFRLSLSVRIEAPLSDRPQGPLENDRPDVPKPRTVRNLSCLKPDKRRASLINFRGAVKGVRSFSTWPSPFRPFWGHQNGHVWQNETGQFVE
jgi:hypothetical protein